MKCPACNSLMIVVEHENIELDYCVNCSGVWFDTEELEFLLEAMQLEGTRLSWDNILTASEARSVEKKRHCPICDRKMKKATIGHEPGVLIDACSGGDGLWFDSGEMGQLITHLSDKPSEKSDSQERVINFLGEVFRVRD